MKIYGMGPSRSLRVIWAAEEAQVDYEYIELKFGSTEEDGTRSEAYLKLNPQGKVPTLQDGDLVLTESGAIVNYLGSKAKGLIPADGTKERAKYDEMCFFILTELEQPLWSTGKHRFALPEEHRVPAIMEGTTAFEFNKAQKALLALKGDSDFVCGDQFTMADVLLGHTIRWADRFKFEVDEKLLAIAEKLFQREAFQKAQARLG